MGLLSHDLEEQEKRRRRLYHRARNFRKCAQCKKLRWCPRRWKSDKKICQTCYSRNVKGLLLPASFGGKEQKGLQNQERRKHKRKIDGQVMDDLAEEKKPKKHGSDRACNICGKPLSTYNSGNACFSHSKNRVDLEGVL